MQLYTVRFTTKKMVKKYDGRGRMISEEKLDNPICMTALPHKTAMQYSGCDNFEIVAYEPDKHGGASLKRAGIGNGTRGVQWNSSSKNVGVKKGEINAATSGGKSSVQRAAETGDMAVAVND